MKSVIIINLLVITFVTSYPADTSVKTNIFEDFKKLSGTKCPELEKSFLTDPNSKYFEECTTLPTETNLTGFNTDKFFCAGVLDAEYKLCNILGSRKFDLPKDYASLNNEINKISKTNVLEVCQSFQKINETAENVTKPFLDQLNTVLKNKETCSKLCQSIFTPTNKFCSLINYVYDLIDQVKALNVTEKSKSTAQLSIPEIKDHIAPEKDNKPVTTTIIAKLPNSQELPSLTNIQAKKTDSTPKNTASQVQTNSQNYLVENNQSQNDKIESKSLPLNVQPVSSTSVKSTTKSQTGSHINLDTGVNQIDKNQLQTDLKPQENGLDTGLAEEQKLNKDEQLTNLDESKEDGVPQNDDLNYPDDDFEPRNEPNIKGNPTLTPRKEYIEKELPEKLLIPGKKYPTQYEDPEDSNFFTYFMFISVLFIGVYVAYHNKQKILALVLEGRRDRNSRRRPNTASYRKLNSNLEEAVTSKSGGSASNIIY